MQVSLAERLTDVSIAAFLWAFRIVVIVIVVVGSVLTLAAGRYSGTQWLDLIADGLSQGSIYALIALGYTMVYGVLRMINFAHGEIFMAGAFGGYFAATGLAAAGLLNQNPFLTLLVILITLVVAMLVAATLAVLVERIAYRPLRNARAWCRSSAPSVLRSFCNIPFAASLALASMPIPR
jgi:branched-chain amino acid transport system permease protein